MTVAAVDRGRSAVLMDAGLAKDALQRFLPAWAPDRLQIEKCSVLHARYRTSPEDVRGAKAFLSVSYELVVRDPARDRRGVQVLHLKAYPEGKSRQKYERARLRCPIAPRFGEAVAHLPELDAVVWAFPNDPKLPHLPEVIDPEAVRRHLPWPRLPPAFDSPVGPCEVQVQVVRYKPEVRCTTRYALRGREKEDPPRFVLYGKTYGHGRAGEISSWMDSLCRQSERPESLKVARALGYSEPVKTVWQEALPGTPMTRILDAGNAAALAHKAATGLAAFHRASLSGLPVRTLEDHLEAIRPEMAEMAQAFPRDAAALGGAVSRLEHDLRGLEPWPAGLAHGDFLLKQLVLHEGQLGLCDFDNLSLADPIGDLSNFVVDLYLQKLDTRIRAEIAGAFLASYAAAAARPLPARRWSWQWRLHVLRNAYFFYKRRQGIGRFAHELGRILALAGYPEPLP